MPTLPMTITALEIELQNPYHCQDVPTIEQLTQWANAALQVQDNTPNRIGTLVIRIVDQAEGLQLNQDYRGKEKATNILSFPFESPPVGWGELDVLHLGDLVICEPVLRQEAIQYNAQYNAQYNKSHLQHWAHLLVHGTLHLQGFDHITDEEAAIMEALEISILAELGFVNPYAEELIPHNSL